MSFHGNFVWNLQAEVVGAKLTKQWCWAVSMGRNAQLQKHRSLEIVSWWSTAVNLQDFLCLLRYFWHFYDQHSLFFLWILNVISWCFKKIWQRGSTSWAQIEKNPLQVDPPSDPPKEVKSDGVISVSDDVWSNSERCGVVGNPAFPCFAGKHFRDMRNMARVTRLFVAGPSLKHLYIEGKQVYSLQILYVLWLSRCIWAD